MLDTKKIIRDYVLQNFLFTNDSSQLTDSESFMDKGIIDSTGILELIMYVETEFQLQVKEAEMTVENFDSVDRIAKFVSGKISISGRAPTVQ